MTQPIPQGYKQTEVGVIPNDWEATSVGQVTSWLSGGTPNRNRDDYWQGDIPWISGSTLKTLELKTSDQFLTYEGVETGSKMAPLGSTLLLVRGSALHTEIRAGLVAAPLCFNQDVKALIPNKNIVPRYLTIYLLAMESELLKLVSSAGNSAGVLDTELVKNFKFLQPPKKEQTAIATALSDVDALISGLESLIAKKQAIKTATMQQLLTGKTRLPQFAHHSDGSAKGYKQTELGLIPEDWGALRLGDLATFANGKPYEDFVVENGRYKLITLDSVSIDGELKRKHKSINFKDGSLLNGDLVCVLSDIAHARLLGLCGLIEEDEVYVLNQRMGRIRFNAFSDPAFMRYLINSNQEFFRTRGQGSSQRHIYKHDVFELVLTVPVKEEQTAIAQILSDMDADIQALETRLSKTKQIKQGMMQVLLTGKVRLVKPELQGMYHAS